MNAKVIAVVVLFAAALAGAVVLALSEGTIEYRTIAEITSDGYGGERIKLKAQVVEIQQGFQPTRFTAIDIVPEGEEAPASPVICTVIYEGDDVPGNLKRSVHVTLEGRYDRARGAFVATMIQTQCPSTYEGSGDPPPAALPASPGGGVEP